MVDVVQYRMERMLDEFEDLEQRGLFSRAEIADIVKKRRKHEYRLKRPSPLKQDFIGYVDYETQLDALRGLHKNSIKSQGNKKPKTSESDFAFERTIIQIYEFTLNRFKGDIDLWFRYLNFLRERKMAE